MNILRDVVEDVDIDCFYLLWDILIKYGIEIVVLNEVFYYLNVKLVCMEFGE